MATNKLSTAGRHIVFDHMLDRVHRSGEHSRWRHECTVDNDGILRDRRVPRGSTMTSGNRIGSSGGPPDRGATRRGILVAISTPLACRPSHYLSLIGEGSPAAFFLSFMRNARH